MKRNINYPPMDPLQAKQIFDIVQSQIEKEFIKYREETATKTVLPKSIDSTVESLEQTFCYTFKRSKGEHKN